jgi:uncharacterized protein
MNCVLRRGIVFALWLILPLETSAAQEISCKQLFMNKSERAICGSEELIQQDLKVGTLSRRAEFVDSNYGHDNKAFRSALKDCKGELNCLSSVYSGRIAYLQHSIDGGRTLTDEEASRVQESDGEATARFAAQADARAKYAPEANERASRANTAAPSDSDEPALAGSKQDTEQAVTEADPSTSVLEPPAAQETPATASPSTSPTPTKQRTDLITLLLNLPWWVWAGTVVTIFLVAHTPKPKCPRCGKRGGVKEIGRHHKGSSTAYRDVTVQDEHRDRSGQLMKTVSRTEQRAYETNHYIVDYRCANCRHEWSGSVSI